MKITKYVHSCLLAETDNSSVLFDPGGFSWESGKFDFKSVKNLDAVVVTHEHPDHFSEEFVKKILSKFPDVRFFSTPKVLDRLKQLKVINLSDDSSGEINIFSKKPHASLGPIGEAPENIAVHFEDYLTVGGDRHDLEESREVLALTVTAPWGSMVSALETALRLKPKKVLPIHDWHWGDAGKKWSYDRMEGVFSENGIEFIRLNDGEPIDL